MTTHEELFAAYVEDLRAAKERAESWWTELQSEAQASGDERARPELRWPFGPASHPWVIAVYRRYFLACEALNEAMADDVDAAPAAPVVEDDWGEDDPAEPTVSRVPPRVLTFEMLESDETADLYEFMISMMYSPIGMKDDAFV